MSTAKPTQKTRKVKTNKFVLILEQFLERYNLSAESSLEQLSEHTPELNALLPDWKARKCIKEALTRSTEKRRAFSKEQKEALVPDQRNMIYSVRKRAQEVAKSEDKWDIFINTLDLGPKGSKDGVIDNKEMVASSSNQSRFCKHLAEYGLIVNLLIVMLKIQRPLRLPTKSSKSGLRSAWLIQVELQNISPLRKCIGD
ncbi:unnamed protein product [Rhizophagus irregularis]|nr:unnamed protein product [Rhizophagus irregularis]